MITTRESINFQYSIVFGYGSPNNNIIVGDVISPGFLPTELLNELSREVMQFLSQFNAMLRDYAGAELFSVEFELLNIGKDDGTSIYPKSMVLLPGNYKGCESLMLALKPEKGVLNVHKSSESINEISKLYFEVEDYINRPELNEVEKKALFNKFASRFTKKLYGDLVENKWNKKLIGVSESLPTEEGLIQYGQLKSEIETSWHKTPIDIKLSNVQFGTFKTPFEGKDAIEHTKFTIAEPSARYIITHTLKLGANLLNLANTGTIDKFQDNIIQFLIKRLKNEEISQINEDKSEEWLISRVNIFLSRFSEIKENYFNICEEFLVSGEKGNLDEVLKSFEDFILRKEKEISNNYFKIWKLTKKFLVEISLKKKNIIANDLRSGIYYFSEIFNKGLKIIEKNLPKYLLSRKIQKQAKILIKNLKKTFNDEENPIQDLAEKFINNFHNFILKNIKIYLLSIKKIDCKNNQSIKDFFPFIIKNLDGFFSKVSVDIEDLLSIAELELKKDYKELREIIDKFKRFPKEIHFLLSYILRYSTINRFLKEMKPDEISQPESFANKFYRFLEKRLAGIHLVCKEYILDWIDYYSKIFSKMHDDEEWTLIEIYNDFKKYMEEKEADSQDPKKFYNILDFYLAKEASPEQKIILLHFLDNYKFFLDIEREFPNYLRDLIIKEINNFDYKMDKSKPLELLNSDEEESFYNYIRETELKYFSKLIPIPSALILKQKFTTEELKQFKKDLFQVFDFNLIGDKKLVLQLKNNFKEVYSIY
ncbi:MAG: hypothetical protein EU547_00185 [Promethearchaeota archaeon]|nr:MAG: hypothetical protein EU547_00185 [Candidatus Lokiarchaeota archaeon]